MAAAAQAGGGDEYPSRSLPLCPLFPTLNRLSTGMALLLLSPSRPLPSLRVPEWLCLLSHARHSLVCSPTPPRGPPHLVSPLPRGVSIPGASGALLSPSRAAAPDCPNAILESCSGRELRLDVPSRRPQTSRGRGRAERGTVPGHPGPRRSPRISGRAPSSRGAAAAGFPGFSGPA